MNANSGVTIEVISCIR